MKKIKKIFLVWMSLVLFFSFCSNSANAGIYFDWQISATARETRAENYQGSDSVLAKVSLGNVVKGIKSGDGAYDCKEFTVPTDGTVNLDWSLESNENPKGYGLIQIGTNGCSVSPIDIFYKYAVNDFPKSGSSSFSVVSGKTYYLYVFAGYYDTAKNFDVTASIDYTWSASKISEWDITGYDSGSALADSTSHQNVDSFGISWQGAHGGSLSNIKGTYTDNSQRVDSYISPDNAESGSVYAKLINSAPIINLLSPGDGEHILSRTPLFKFSYYDFDGDSQYAFRLQIAEDPGFNNMVFDTGTAVPGATSYQLQPANQLDKGKTYYWRVKAQDKQDTTGEWGDYSTPRSFVIENSVPVLNVINDIEANENELIKIIVNASDEDGDTLTYHINDSRFTQNNNVFTWQTKEDDAGNYTILVRVGDGFSNVSQIVHIAINKILKPVFIYVDPAHKSIPVGKNFTIDIKINTTQEVYALQFTLLYDYAVLNADSVAEGDFLNKDGASTFPFATINNTEGKVVFADTILITQSGVRGDGKVASVNLNARNAGSTILNLKNVVVLDPQVKALPVIVGNGDVDVTSLEGDVNGDCKVDVFDLATIGLAFGSESGQSRWKENADLTGDGKIDIFDLATVGLNYGKSC